MSPPVQPPPSPSAPGTAADEATELAYWAAARDSNDIRDVDAYLTTYPRGRFVLLARNKVERMRLAMNSEPPAARPPQPARPETPPPQPVAWRAAGIALPAGETGMSARK